MKFKVFFFITAPFFFFLFNANLSAAAWQVETVDSTDDMGKHTSIALDGDGNPHISYYNNTDEDLKYAHYDGSWQIETVDSTDDMGKETSIALDSSGNPYISYYDNTDKNLKYAYYNGSWQIETVDSGGADDVGKATSIALDSSGNPYISYYDNTNKDLKYAYHNGSWQIETVDSAGDAGKETSIVLDNSGNPYIGYYDNTNKDLKYAFITPISTTTTTAASQTTTTVASQTTTTVASQTTTIPPTTTSALTTTTTTTMDTSLCVVTISPDSKSVYPGETLQFSTTESGECNTSCYTWDITSDSGSTVDDNGLYTAGDIPGTDVVIVTDLCNEDVEDITTVTIISYESYEIAIAPDNKIIASEGIVNFSAESRAVTSAYGSITLNPPDYEWFVESEIGSSIDSSTGEYTAGENDIGYQVTDVITVIDHANGGTKASEETMVTYGKINFIFPTTILASRWIFVPNLCVLFGENLNIDPFSTVLRFEPNDDIIPVCQFGFGDFILFMVLVNPNPVTDGANIIVDTNGELAVANNMPLNIGMLPWIFDDTIKANLK